MDAGFVRALQPARWGGGEVHLREFADAVMTISAASPSAGWVAGVIGVHPWQLALFDEQAQHEMWSDSPARMHSSSYNPTGKAEKVDGGYLVSGRWSFSSGCDHCEGVILGAICGSIDPGIGKAIADFRSFLLHVGQYRVEDNWHVAGLKGTGSKDIVVESAFVTKYRTQSHLDYAMGNPLPGQQTNPSPLYRLPWSVVFNLAIVASMLGSARGFVDAWTADNSSRVVAGGRHGADDPLAQRRLAEALWTLDAAVALVHADIDAIWAMAQAGVMASMADRAHWRWNMNRSCDLVGNSVAELSGPPAAGPFSWTTRCSGASRTSRALSATLSCYPILSPRPWPALAWAQPIRSWSCDRESRSWWRSGAATWLILAAGDTVGVLNCCESVGLLGDEPCRCWIPCRWWT